MLDTLRRALAAGLLFLAFVGLLPMLPQVFGFYSAAITNSTAGTYYPSASSAPASRYVACSQFQPSYQIRKNRQYTGNYFQCTNNWNSTVGVDLSLANGNSLLNSAASSSTVSIPPGGTACVAATIAANNSVGGPGTVSYRITVNGANPGADLYAELEFTGQIEVINSNPTHTLCP